MFYVCGCVGVVNQHPFPAKADNHVYIMNDDFNEMIPMSLLSILVLYPFFCFHIFPILVHLHRYLRASDNARGDSRLIIYHVRQGVMVGFFFPTSAARH